MFTGTGDEEITPLVPLEFLGEKDLGDGLGVLEPAVAGVNAFDPGDRDSAGLLVLGREEEEVKMTDQIGPVSGEWNPTNPFYRWG